MVWVHTPYGWRLTNCIQICLVFLGLWLRLGFVLGLRFGVISMANIGMMFLIQCHKLYGLLEECTQDFSSAKENWASDLFEGIKLNTHRIFLWKKILRLEGRFSPSCYNHWLSMGGVELTDSRVHKCGVVFSVHPCPLKWTVLTSVLLFVTIATLLVYYS